MAGIESRPGHIGFVEVEAKGLPERLDVALLGIVLAGRLAGLARRLLGLGRDQILAALDDAEVGQRIFEDQGRTAGPDVVMQLVDLRLGQSRGLRHDQDFDVGRDGAVEIDRADFVLLLPLFDEFPGLAHLARLVIEAASVDFEIGLGDAQDLLLVGGHAADGADELVLDRQTGIEVIDHHGLAAIGDGGAEEHFVELTAGDGVGDDLARLEAELLARHLALFIERIGRAVDRDLDRTSGAGDGFELGLDLLRLQFEIRGQVLTDEGGHLDPARNAFKDRRRGRADRAEPFGRGIGIDPAAMSEPGEIGHQHQAEDQRQDLGYHRAAMAGAPAPRREMENCQAQEADHQGERGTDGAQLNHSAIEGIEPVNLTGGPNHCATENRADHEGDRRQRHQRAGQNARRSEHQAGQPPAGIVGEDQPDIGLTKPHQDDHVGQAAEQGHGHVGRHREELADHGVEDRQRHGQEVLFGAEVALSRPRAHAQGGNQDHEEKRHRHIERREVGDIAGEIAIRIEQEERGAAREHEREDEDVAERVAEQAAELTAHHREHCPGIEGRITGGRRGCSRGSHVRPPLPWSVHGNVVRGPCQRRARRGCPGRPRGLR